MKKIIAVGLVAGFLGTATAQEMDLPFSYGAKAGLGLATMNDDLSTKSPLLGFNVGGYLRFSFLNSESIFADMFYLQTELSLNRRGCHYRNVFERGTDLSIRTGHYNAFYLQLPILAGIRYELPIRSEGHIVGFYLGPAVSYGLFGSYSDRMVHPGSPDRNTNYDLAVDGTPDDLKVFNHLNRLDVSAIIGLSYEWQRFTVTLSVDYGLTATSESDDILRILESREDGQVVYEQIPGGHNVAYLLSVAYRIGKF